MKAESTIFPSPFTLEDIGDGRCLLTFYENIVELPAPDWETEGGSETKYQYDEYRLETKHRDGLYEQVEGSLAEWLQAAKKSDTLRIAAEVRAKRDAMLGKSDKFALTDFPITDAQRSLVIAYRQALRDIPEQDGFPYEIDWPELDL